MDVAQEQPFDSNARHPNQVHGTVELKNNATIFIALSLANGCE